MKDKIFCTLSSLFPYGAKCMDDKCEKTCGFYDQEKGNAELMKAARIFKEYCGDNCEDCFIDKIEACGTVNSPAHWNLEENNGK